MEESQCVLKYLCALSCRPFLMCTSVPAGPGLHTSIHFISNYSLSLGQTLVEFTPARAEQQHLYLDILHIESCQQVELKWSYHINHLITFSSCRAEKIKPETKCDHAAELCFVVWASGL